MTRATAAAAATAGPPATAATAGPPATAAAARAAIATAVEAGADWLVAPELAPDPADRDLAPLYSAAARGVLVMPFCAGCDIPLELEQIACDACGQVGPRWREVPRIGTVHAATLVHRREPGLIVADAPYPVLDVELASGHRVILTTTQACPHSPGIGTRVDIAFRRVGDVAVPAAHAPGAPAGQRGADRELLTGESMP
jgi:uncharacterized OB-fold protein